MPEDLAAPPTAADPARWIEDDRAAQPVRLARLRRRLAGSGLDANFGIRPEHGRHAERLWSAELLSRLG
jgi:hypothetical protein